MLAPCSDPLAFHADLPLGDGAPAYAAGLSAGLAAGLPDGLPGGTPDSALADMAEVLAHRMRSLLGGIQGYTDLLTDTLATYEQRELAMRIFEGVAGLEGILAGLRRFAEAPVAVCRPLDPRALAEEMPLAVGGRGGRVAVMAPEAGPLRADGVLLRQALLLLLQNALDASAGAVALALAPGAGGVTFRVTNAGELVPGVPERMFRPFYTTKAQHLGLGLPLARRIAEAHGGRLEWEPRGGETTLALFVPHR